MHADFQWVCQRRGMAACKQGYSFAEDQAHEKKKSYKGLVQQPGCHLHPFLVNHHPIFAHWNHNATDSSAASQLELHKIVAALFQRSFESSSNVSRVFLAAPRHQLYNGLYNHILEQIPLARCYPWKARQRPPFELVPIQYATPDHEAA